MIKKNKKLIKNEEGQALVEFSLIFPILILIVFGIIEFGWLLNAQITLNSAVREGVRVGAVLNTTDAIRRTKMLEAVHNTANQSGLTILDNECIINVNDDSSTNTYNISIIVHADVNSIIGIYVPDTITLSSNAVMRRE